MLRYPSATQRATRRRRARADVVVPADRDAGRRPAVAVPPRYDASEIALGAEPRVEHARGRARPAPRGCPRTASSGGAGEQARHELVAEHESRAVSSVSGAYVGRDSRADFAPTVARRRSRRARAARPCASSCSRAVRNGRRSGEPDAEELDGDDG